MTSYLVRHAKAGDRSDWEGDDRLRPLSPAGERQALALVDLLKDAGIQAVLSSPYRRCIQTVEPVARQFGLSVEPEGSLAEGAGGDTLIQLIRRLSGRNAVLCTHGDVLEEFLEHLIRQGVVPGARARLEKGSTWVVDEEGGRIVKARYLPPP
ncbi:MAG: phosphoglycerate mutase family protein [Candidatus Dormibacter sp.]